jgi:hypothetical protein
MSERPFKEFDFSEEMEKILRTLETDPIFMEEFPIDLRTYLFYESCRQKTVSFSMFNDKEMSTQSYYFMNLDLGHFFESLEEAIGVLHSFPRIAENFLCNPEKEFVATCRIDGVETIYSQQEFTDVLTHYLYPSQVGEDDNLEEADTFSPLRAEDKNQSGKNDV